MNAVARVLVCVVLAGCCRVAVAAPAATVDARIEALTQFLGGYPPQFANAAEEQRVRRDYAALEAELGRWLKAHPADLNARVQRGRLRALGHNMDAPRAWEGADADLRAVLKADPKRVDALVALGSLYVSSDPALAPKAEALFIAAQCVAGATPVEEAQRGIYFARYYQGRIDEAKAEADYLVATWPKVEVYRQLQSTAAEVLARRKPAQGTPATPARPVAMATCPH